MPLSPQYSRCRWWQSVSMSVAILTYQRAILDNSLVQLFQLFLQTVIYATNTTDQLRNRPLLYKVRLEWVLSECETDRTNKTKWPHSMPSWSWPVSRQSSFLNMCQTVHSQTKTLDKFTTETLTLSCNCGLDRFGVLYQWEKGVTVSLWSEFVFEDLHYSSVLL